MDQITIPLSDNELDWLDDFLLYRVDEDEADARAGEADEGILDVSELDGSNCRCQRPEYRRAIDMAACSVGRL
jgi:hypothetical protein